MKKFIFRENSINRIEFSWFQGMNKNGSNLRFKNDIQMDL